MKKRLLIATSTFGEYLDETFLKKMTNKFHIIQNPYKRKMTKKELLFYLQKYKIEYVISGLEVYDKEVIESSNLKIISRLGSGMSNIDIKLAKSKKIKIFSTPHAPTNAVAELTLSMILNLLKDSFKMNNKMRNKKWERYIGNLLEEKTVLIVGYGNIGKRLSKLLKPFNVNLLICDKKFKINKLNQFKSLSLALPKADIVTFHVNKDEVMLGENEIKFLKKGVFILNASRGRVIDEKALIKCLRNRIVKRAWIDVFDEEPYFGKLSSFENVILTPHIGSYTKETREQMEIESFKNIINNL